MIPRAVLVVVVALNTITIARADNSSVALTRSQALELTSEKLAKRAFSQLAETIWESHVEYLLPPSNPPFLGTTTFFTRPAPMSPGICGVNALSVDFSPEKRPAPTGSIGDPPSRAVFVQTSQRFLVVGPLGTTDAWNEENTKATTEKCAALNSAQS
ncbi:MAG TPA: hypothetical protein VHW02_04095, partial [Rhizomicrobium sp.]|nr:hypothetical protein [Rhizomicrobium sp.]